MIPERGNRKRFMRALFDQFPQPVKGQVWGFRTVYLPSLVTTVMRAEIVTSRVTGRGRVTYRYIDGTPGKVGSVDFRDWMRLSIRGEVTLLQG
jgi:hypothetical protein